MVSKESVETNIPFIVTFKIVCWIWPKVMMKSLFLQRHHFPDKFCKFCLALFVTNSKNFCSVSILDFPWSPTVIVCRVERQLQQHWRSRGCDTGWWSKHFWSVLLLAGTDGSSRRLITDFALVLFFSYSAAAFSYSEQSFHYHFYH